jgi:hypothetical protein
MDSSEYDFKNLCDLTTKVMGLPEGSLSLKSRKRNLHIARASAGVIAIIQDDTHKTIIGKVLNRDRTTIIHYENTHKFNYTSCLVYRNTFNKIYTAYKNLEDTKKVFLDDDFLKEHLIKNGVFENIKSQVLVEVKSKDSMCIIKTSYFDFANQLTNIKKAMKGYNYKISIL